MLVEREMKISLRRWHTTALRILVPGIFLVLLLIVNVVLNGVVVGIVTPHTNAKISNDTR
jgi:hypothetical protein